MQLENENTPVEYKYFEIVFRYNTRVNVQLLTTSSWQDELSTKRLLI